MIHKYVKAKVIRKEIVYPIRDHNSSLNLESILYNVNNLSNGVKCLNLCNNITLGKNNRMRGFGIDL